VTKPEPTCSERLYRKLFNARKSAEAVTKRGPASQEDGGYFFARSEDVLAEASKQLEKRRVLIVPQVIEERLHFSPAGFAIATVVMEFEVVDVDGGGSLTRRWSGTGHDRPGDKASFKAQTGCEKYFLAKLLGIPFGTDPEAEARPVDVAEEDGELRLNIGALCRRLEAAGHPAERDNLALLLGASGVTAELPEDEEAIAATELVVSAKQLEAIETEVLCIEQDAAAEQTQEPEVAHG
jgi:hypothetical protein